jgi:hypothetical protein
VLIAHFAGFRGRHIFNVIAAICVLQLICSVLHGQPNSAHASHKAVTSPQLLLRVGSFGEPLAKRGATPDLFRIAGLTFTKAHVPVGSQAASAGRARDVRFTIFSGAGVCCQCGRANVRFSRLVHSERRCKLLGYGEPKMASFQNDH